MLSKYGRILKAFSLDELPQLYNVLLGDMAMVGPRPLLPDYSNRIEKACPERMKVRPGITGLAQISGRNFLSWEEQWKLDAEYVDRRNFGLDLIILLRTPISLLDIRAALHHRRPLLEDE
jgi:lipopolysaccharide/colanic/teichoic acid biosynthesis glycosyltransferase